MWGVTLSVSQDSELKHNKKYGVWVGNILPKMTETTFRQQKIRFFNPEIIPSTLLQ